MDKTVATIGLGGVGALFLLLLTRSSSSSSGSGLSTLLQGGSSGSSSGSSLSLPSFTFPTFGLGGSSTGTGTTGTSLLNALPSSFVDAPTPYQSAFAAASQRYGVPYPLLVSVARAESNFSPSAVSYAGAEGIMQMEPQTARQYGIDPFNPSQAIPAAAHYLSSLKSQFGSWTAALAAYNWGPGNLSQAIQQYGSAWVMHLPTQTLTYVSRISAWSGVA